MRYRELARPDSPVLGVNLNVGNHGYDRVAALCVGEPSSVQYIGVTGPLAVRWLASLSPARLLSGGPHDCGIAWRADVLQSERHRIYSCRSRDLVDELLASEVHLRPQRVPQVRSSQRRASIQQRRHDFPRQQLGVEGVALGRSAQPRPRVERQAQRHPREAIARI